MSEYISFDEQSYLMNRIAYWLINTGAKFKTRALYGYFGREADYATIVKVIKERGTNYQSDALISEFVECAIVDNSNDLSFLPNYVSDKNGKKYYKDCYVDMARRVSAYEVLNGKSPAIVYIQNPNTASVTATTTTVNDTYNYFVKKFGTITDFDSALAKIKGRGYAYYYNSAYNNTTAIDRMYNRKGINCTDSAQVMYKVAIALGYTVQFVHVKCSSGTGHIRLRLKHDKNTGGQWIYRDPAAVLNGNAVTSNWCSNGTIIAYDPAWIFTDLN